MEFSWKQLRVKLTLLTTALILISCNSDEITSLRKENNDLKRKIDNLKQNYIFENARIRVEQDTLRDYSVGEIYDFRFSVVAYNDDDYFYPSENDTLLSKAVIENKDGVYHYRRILSDTANYIKIDFKISDTNGKKIEGALYDIIKAKR